MSLTMLDHKFTSRESIRKALVTAGFVNAHARPGLPEPWVRVKDPTERYAVACQNGELWYLVTYPELDNTELAWLES